MDGSNITSRKGENGKEITYKNWWALVINTQNSHATLIFLSPGYLLIKRTSEPNFRKIAF